METIQKSSQDASEQAATFTKSTREVWRIGRALRIKGELTADMNVSIDGDFEGVISLTEHELCTGAASRVVADISAARILIRGEVVGDITASERITIARTAKVLGSIKAPRVKLEPDCTVDGEVVSGRF